MGPTWEPSFNFYLTEFEQAPVSVVLDMNAEPLPSHPVRLQLRVKLLHPRADGLRDSVELEPMGRLEDQLVERLAAAFDAVYVGRYVTQGATVFVTYVPASANVETCVDVIGATDPYAVEWLSERDPDWRFFHEVLYPDVYALQTMLSLSLLDQLHEAGDDFRLQRPVDHVAYFEQRPEAEGAATALGEHGFRVEELKTHEAEPSTWVLKFHRDERLDESRPDVFVAEVLDVVTPLNGRYGGWGCPVTKSETS